MIDITEILLYKHRDCQSIKQISKTTGHSKNTIRHYLRDYEEFVKNQQTGTQCTKDYKFFVEDYVLSIRFNTPEPTRRVLTPEIIEKIDNHLHDNIIKRRTGLKKQVMRKENIHQDLIDNGHNISYSSVCKYITNKYGPHYTEAFIKQYHELGASAEFDWGEVKLYIKGVLRKFKMGAFVLPGSTARWGKLYQHENTLSLQEAHVDFIAYVGGVPMEIVYDNMKVAVIYTKDGKKPTQGLMNLMNHYGFKHRFCNEYRGNEKGGVELTVSYLRNLAFSRKLEFESIEEANEHLQKCYERNNLKESNIELFKQEKTVLMPYEYDYQCTVISTGIVDKLSTICYDKTHYSVPDAHVDKTVEIRIHSDMIRIFYDRKEICRHDRSYRPTWRIKLDHYLKTLSYKSGALKNSVALRQAPERIKELYNEWFSDNPKEFIELLKYLQDNKLSYSDLYSIVDKLKADNINKVNVHILRQGLESLSINTESQSFANTCESQEAKEIEEYADRDINSLSDLTKKTA